MNTTPSSTLHFTSTTASDRPRSDQDQLQVDATRRVRAAGERALVLGGGGSAGNAWLIGVIAGLFDAGLDVTEADLIIGTSAGSTAAAQITGASPTELLADILVRCAPATDWSGRIRRWTRSQSGRWPTIWRGRARSSPPLRMRPTCAADWVRRRSKWMRRRTAPGKRGGALPSPPGCPVSTGRNERCSSRRSMPIPVNRSCSTATAESTWWTPSPPACASGSRLRHRRQPIHRRRLPTIKRECRSGSRIRAGAGAVTTWRQITGAAGVGHASCSAGRRTTRPRQQSRNHLPG